MRYQLTPLLLLLAAAPLAGAPQGDSEPNAAKVHALLQAPLPGQDAGGSLTAQNRLEYHARGESVRNVFEQLGILAQRNIVVAPTVSATYSGDLFDVDIDEAIRLVCKATGLVATQEDGYVFVTLPELRTEMFVLEHARAQDLIPLITPILLEGEAVTATTLAKQGIDSEDEDSGGNDYASSEVIMMRAYSATLERVTELVQILDGEPKQVLMEATILSAELAQGMEFGVQFDVLGGANFREIGASSGDGQSLNHPGLGPGNLETGATTTQTNTLSGISNGGLNLGFINGDVAAFVRALQTYTNTTILANTSIMTLNKQRGEVLLGRRDGYLTTTVGETTSTQEVEFIETGTQLIYRPFIGRDGKIRLEIHPEDSEGGVNDQGLPFKETAEITTNILVRDGDTVVIGGLFRTRTNTSENKVPIVGDIPFAGNLFRGNREETVREEIIILLTPHIVELGDVRTDTIERVSRVTGADRAPVRRLYQHTARALSLEGEHGSALILLDAARDGAPESTESLELRATVLRGIVPSYSGAAADRWILDAMLANLNAGS